MAHSAPRFVRLGPSDHDLGRIVGGRTPTDEPLIPAGWPAAQDADRVELVNYFRDRHQVGHRTERLPAKVRISPRDDDAPSPTRQRSHQRDDSLIHELGFVDGDYVSHRIDLLGDLRSRVGGDRLDGATVVAGDRIDASVPRVESKGAKILELIGRPKGASLAEIQEATDWQKHSIRGFLSTAAKKHGIKIESTKTDAGDRVYQIRK